MARPEALSPEALDQLFTAARTHHAWASRSVAETTLRELYDLLKWGPTAVNACPARFLFITSREAKDRLLPCLSPGNVEQVRSAPVTVVAAYDLSFPETLPRLFPVMDVKKTFAGNAALSESTAFRNGTLQGAYLILAARSLGLDAGPMSGFDNAKLDEAFFKGTSWKSNFLCNLGYGDDAKLYPRGPRLAFEETCRIL